jgi:hypothetical protein
MLLNATRHGLLLEHCINASQTPINASPRDAINIYFARAINLLYWQQDFALVSATCLDVASRGWSQEAAKI